MSFDEKAKEWDKDPKKVARAQVFADEIIAWLDGRKIKSALEFGSGTGLVSFCLNDRFEKITLADNSKGMMEVLKEKIARTNASNMTPLLVDIFNDPLPAEGFEIIYTLLTLHHIRDVEKTLSVFNGILKKGGYLCIGDLITEDGTFHHKDPDFDGHKGFDTGEFKTWLNNQGFTVETEKIFSVIEKEYDSVLRKYPMFLIISKKI